MFPSDSRKRQGGGDGYYDMPFNTIENVDLVDATHIVVGDDNNLPFSAGRAVDKADDNEFVLLEVGELLSAKQDPLRIVVPRRSPPGLAPSRALPLLRGSGAIPQPRRTPSVPGA